MTKMIVDFVRLGYENDLKSIFMLEHNDVTYEDVGYESENEYLVETMI